jgi:hypothetical protein
MPKNDIGGFFVSLGLGIDKNSFETGNRYIDGVTNALNKLIGTARNAAVVLTGTAVASGVIESSAYKTSVALGVTTEALDLWKASAKIAGVDANGLIGSMGQLANVMNHMKIDGSGLEQFSKKLGELGIVTDKVDIAKMLEMSPDELMKEIISKAQEAVKNGNNLTQVSTIVGDILGESGMNFFIELQRQGKTIDEFLAGAQKTVFTDSTSNEKAADLAVEINTLKTTAESISKKLGSEVAGGLTPIVNSINSWIQNNGKTITDALENIGSLVETIANSALLGDVGKAMSAAIKLVAGDKKGALEDLRNTSASKEINTKVSIQQEIDDWLLENGYRTEGQAKIGFYNAFNRASVSELPEDLQNKIYEYASSHKFNDFSGIKLKDGIMRPDGTVTQVAPDDWVFAARNLGDLARAFIPQNYTAASSSNEYVINQTFNINGGNDMPQVLRQQAYRGTQEGLLEIMNQSSQRMQLMSGTR